MPFPELPAEESALFAKAELMLAVSGIAMRSDWDAAGATIDKIKCLALEAAANPRLELCLDEAGEPMYRSFLTNLNIPADDNRRGRLALRFPSGTFSGIDVDMQAFDKGRYHLYPDSTLVSMSGENRGRRVGRLRGRMLWRHVGSLGVSFTDPRMVAEYFAPHNR